METRITLYLWVLPKKCDLRGGVGKKERMVFWFGGVIPNAHYGFMNILLNHINLNPYKFYIIYWANEMFFTAVCIVLQFLFSSDSKPKKKVLVIILLSMQALK